MGNKAYFLAKQRSRSSHAALHGHVNNLWRFSSKDLIAGLAAAGCKFLRLSGNSKPVQGVASGLVLCKET